MLVRTHNIPTEGLEVDFAIPVEVLRKTIPENDELVHTLDHPVECEVHLQMVKKDIYLSGQARTSIRPICDRCAEAFDLPLNLDLSLTCSPNLPNPKHLKKVDAYQESDDGVIFFDHEELDLIEIVREQLILSIPMQTLCREDCQGLCPQCGANLNLGSHACEKKPHH